MSDNDALLLGGLLFMCILALARICYEALHGDEERDALDGER